MAVLNLNNMRDIESDALSGKKTFALRLGYKKAMIYEIILLQLPILLMLTFLMINFASSNQGVVYYPFIVMILMFPFMKLRRTIMKIQEPKLLDPFLKQVGILTFMMAVLTAVGLNFVN